MFVEDQTLKDVEKVETVPQPNDDLTDLDPIPPQHVDPVDRDDVQNDEHNTDDVDAPEQPEMDEDVHLELPVPDMPPFVPLRRFVRDRHPSA